MKQLCARLLVIAALGVLLATVGCIVNKTDLVITDNICVNIDEHETTGTFTTFTVVDQFKTELEKKLAEYGKGFFPPASMQGLEAVRLTDGSIEGAQTLLFGGDEDALLDSAFARHNRGRVRLLSLSCYLCI